MLESYRMPQRSSSSSAHIVERRTVKLGARYPIGRLPMHRSSASEVRSTSSRNSTGVSASSLRWR